MGADPAGHREPWRGHREQQKALRGGRRGLDLGFHRASWTFFCGVEAGEREEAEKVVRLFGSLERQTPR